MPAIVRYCSFCGQPAERSSHASAFSVCAKCHTTTLGIAPGWQSQENLPVSLPLAPRLASRDLFWECESCQAELSLEIALSSHGQPCSGCADSIRLLEQALSELGSPARPACPLLTQEEMAFLSSSGGIAR